MLARAHLTVTPRLVLAGGVLVAAAPLVWVAFSSLKWPLSRALPADIWEIVYYTPLAASSLVLAGFVLIGAGLSEKRGRPYGGLLGAVLYLGPAFLFWLGRSAIQFHDAEWGEALVVAALWPFWLAFEVGWFGLGPG